MSETSTPIQKQIQVWDKFVRVFHWLLVIVFFLAYITEDDFMTVHIWAGYSVLALVVSRIVWGFIGSSYARFSNFIYSPDTVLNYLDKLKTLSAKRYIGHNPAGGAMILLLLFNLLMICLSGILLDQIESGSALWNHMNQAWAFNEHLVEDMMEEIHEFFANFTLLLVFLHVGGVIFESILHRENLVKSMINGYKESDTKNTEDL